jgi:hypothetical protein
MFRGLSMKLSNLRLLVPVAIGILIGLSAQRIHAPITTATAGVTAGVATKVPSAYGFFANMTKEQYMAAYNALKADPHNPFVKLFVSPNPDGKTADAIGFVFPVAKFMEVAKHVAGENGGSLPCRKVDVIVCKVVDAAGNEVILIDNAAKNKKTGEMFGVLLIADKNHMAPAKQDNKQDSKVVLAPGQFDVTYRAKYGNVQV